MDNLKPSNDFVFKKLFGTEKNKDILKDLLEAILPDIEIKDIHIKNDVHIETINATAIVNNASDLPIFFDLPITHTPFHFSVKYNNS